MFRATKFDAVGQTQSDARKRAFVITTSSVAPNTFVIGIDNEAKSISEHASGDSQRARGRLRCLAGRGRGHSRSCVCGNAADRMNIMEHTTADPVSHETAL